jgi:tryptophan synthase alpha chain
MSRIAQRFAKLRAEARSGLIAFIMAGDPDMASFERLLAGMPAAGADILEIGMPFSDPMADGPAIQAAGLRALRAGAKLAHILRAVSRFREIDAVTPIVLMGYYNPVFRYGPERFAHDAAAAGVDGVILVDLPPEEANEFHPYARGAGLDLIRLTTPTSDDARLPKIVEGASGFLYHVAIAGITGTVSADAAHTAQAVGRIRLATNLPIAVGFGIRSPEQAEEVARFADAAVVGSAIVETIGRIGAAPALAETVHAQIRALAAGVRRASLPTPSKNAL